MFLNNNYNSTLQDLVYINNKPQDLSDGTNKICLNWGVSKPALQGNYNFVLFNWQLGKCPDCDGEPTFRSHIFYLQTFLSLAAAW